MRANDYRTAGRYASQDKARRAGKAAIEAAEDRFVAARGAYLDSTTDDNRAEYKAAEDALEALDPKNSLFY